MKFIIAVLVSLFVIIPTQTAQASPDGTYSNEDFVAQVQGKTIHINWVFDDGDSALYWQGTFPWKSSGDIRSKRDVEAMEFALFASQQKYKIFRLRGSKLTFEWSALGVTRKATLYKE